RRKVRVVDRDLGQERLAGHQLIKGGVGPAKAKLELAEGDHRPRLVKTHSVSLRQLQRLGGVSAALIRPALAPVAAAPSALATGTSSRTLSCRCFCPSDS